MALLLLSNLYIKPKIAPLTGPLLAPNCVLKVTLTHYSCISRSEFSKGQHLLSFAVGLYSVMQAFSGCFHVPADCSTAEPLCSTQGQWNWSNCAFSWHNVCLVVFFWLRNNCHASGALLFELLCIKSSCTAFLKDKCSECAESLVRSNYRPPWF